METRLATKRKAESKTRVTRSMKRNSELNDITNIQPCSSFNCTGSRIRPLRISPTKAYELSAVAAQSHPKRSLKRPLDEDFVDTTILRLPGRDPPAKQRRVHAPKTIPSRSPQQAVSQQVPQELENPSGSTVTQATRTFRGDTRNCVSCQRALPLSEFMDFTNNWGEHPIRSVCNTCLEDDKNYRRCPSCYDVTVMKPTSDTDADKGWIRCGCGTVFCWTHESTHTVSCAVMNERLMNRIHKPYESNPDYPIMKYLWGNRANLKTCPNPRCREVTVFEENSGHLTCPACTHEWCGSCDKPWDPIAEEGPWHHGLLCRHHVPSRWETFGLC